MPTDNEKREYDIEYKKVYILDKRVSFNKKMPDDMEMLNWLKTTLGKRSFCAYVKKLIRQDMIEKQLRRAETEDR